MDQFADRLSRLGELPDADVSALEQELITAFDAADNAGDVDTMSQIADALDTVRAESKRRAGGATEDQPGATPDAATPDAAPAAPAMAASIEEEPEENPTVAEAEVETTTSTTDEAPAEVPAEDPTPEVEAPAAAAEAPTTDDTLTPAEADEAVVTEAEAIVAEAETAAVEDGLPPKEGSMDDELLDAGVVPDENQPGDEVARTPATLIRAGGDIPGFAAGSEMEGMGQVAEALSAKINTLRNTTGGNGEKLIVASFQSQVEEEDRILHRGDPVGNSRKIQAATKDPEALTAAANGWCAPRTPIYNIFGVGSTDRPVRDSLTSFSADRGGIVWSTPPKLSGGNYGAGVWVWESTEWQGSAEASGTATDNTKVLFTATCPGEETRDLEAITTQVKFTNMMARAYPELVRRNNELALIATARFAESRTLRWMWAASTDVAENNSVPLGATRDTLFALSTMATSFRNRHRMNPTDTMDCWAPAWLRDQVVNDLMIQTPGDQVGLSVALGEIDGYLSSRNINVTWFLDTIPGFATAQIAATDHTLPVNAGVIMAPPGSFLHLDGGTLDLGVVRDGDLVATNEYIEFTETFENVAFVGVEALANTLPVVVVGGTANTEDTTAGLVLS